MNVYAKATPLPNARGRVNYISSPKRQEHLVAVSGVTDKQFWSDLSHHCQKAAAEAGHSKACEAREWAGALPNVYATLFRGREEILAKEISELIKQETGTENITALHWNKNMTNFHFHSVVSENPEINEVVFGAVLQKNTYFDAKGKRSTKGKCVDPVTKKLLPGCEMLRKGERKKTVKRFGAKVDLYDKDVTERIKKALAEKYNRDLQLDKLTGDVFQVFEDDGIHLTEQHIGKKVSKAVRASIQEKNRLVREYNATADALWALSMKDEGLNSLVIKTLRSNKKKLQSLAGDWLKWLETLKTAVKRMKDFLNLKLKEAENCDLRLAENENVGQIEKSGQNERIGKNEPNNGSLDSLITGAKTRRKPKASSTEKMQHRKRST